MKLLRLALFSLTLILLLAGLLLPVTAQEDVTPGGPMPTPGIPPTATPIPRPLPTTTLTEERATVEFFFAALAQGETGLIHISGSGLAGARLRYLNDLIEFFPAPDGFYGLLAINMEQTPRVSDLDILAWYDDGTRQTINTQFEVTLGRFIKQDVTIAQDKAYLVDPEIERSELARLESIFAKVTTERLWDTSGFVMPIPGGELTSPFGAFRTFNQSMQTRHTGWDIRATLGQPVLASASGTVVYAGFMDIRGNIVIIDHGFGVFTTYCHFSQVHVTRGQTITAGQVLGTVGNTGRTSGPHFHWEVAVNGSFVDANQFFAMWKPS
ncbi:MAG: M23 family metallopeptidase [Anaerolineae bacterium]|nr:M23 family metallopeptidase [Anaerolineae bacterium]